MAPSRGMQLWLGNKNFFGWKQDSSTTKGERLWLCARKYWIQKAISYIMSGSLNWNRQKNLLNTLKLEHKHGMNVFSMLEILVVHSSSRNVTLLALLVVPAFTVSVLERDPRVELLGSQTTPDDVVRQCEDLCRLQSRCLRKQNRAASQSWNSKIKLLVGRQHGCFVALLCEVKSQSKFVRE